MAEGTDRFVRCTELNHLPSNLTGRRCTDLEQAADGRIAAEIAGRPGLISGAPARTIPPLFSRVFLANDNA